MICCVVYLLRIFKMFHGLMNNPVYEHNFEVGAFSVSGFKFSNTLGDVGIITSLPTLR
jgi:hypothetical protein